MSTQSEQESTLSKLRVGLFHTLCWVLIVLGSLGAAFVVFAVVVADNTDPSSIAQWVLVLFGIGLCSLLALIGIKGLKLRSTSDLEAQDEEYERRRAKIEAWLNGIFKI